MTHGLQLVIACDDPTRLARFWAGALGYVEQPPPPGFESWEDFADGVGLPEDRRNDIAAVVDPDGVGPRILFEKWDGGGPSKRLHLDLNSVGELAADLTDDERRNALAAERERLEALGASYAREASGMAGENWIEMYDPEGNWFCVQ